jgi:hypothetical protein
VDSGFVSLAKTQPHPDQDPHRSGDAGFFIAGRIGAGVIESVPARGAHRRLATGPTPAALFSTGQ